MGRFLCSRSETLLRLNGNINAYVYQNLIQQHPVRLLRAPFNQLTIFIQDNAPCYTAKRIEKFLADEEIEI